jgi:hypothetical protein
MKNKICVLIFLSFSFVANAQVSSHNIIFKINQLELDDNQKQEIQDIMTNCQDGQKLTLFPVTVDQWNSKYVFDKIARDQASEIATYCQELGFELLGMPTNFPTNHKGLSAGVQLKYHKPLYLDKGEEPYTLKANYPEKESQFFLINPLKDTTIYGEEGTVIHIPAGGLTTRELVEFELKEFYRISDLMINDLSTVSNGHMIQTGGSLYMDAKEHKSKRAVGINQQKGLDIAFTDGKNDNEMQVFIKDPNSSKMNWILPRQSRRSYKWSMTEIVMDAEGNEISSTTYNSKEEWEAHLKQEEIKRKKEEERVAQVQQNQDKLKVYDLGYINCDKYYNEPKTPLAVTPDALIEAEYFIIFNGERGVLKGNNYGGSVSFGAVPKDKTATLFAVSFIGDKVYFYKKELSTNSGFSTTVSLQPTNKSYVDQQLAMLK